MGYGSIEDRGTGTSGPWEDCETGENDCEDGLAEASYLRLPGYDQALVLDWKSDNTGPPGCGRDTALTPAHKAGNGVSRCNLTAGTCPLLAIATGWGSPNTLVLCEPLDDRTMLWEQECFR